MALQLQIPDSVAQSIRLPEKSLPNELLKELSLALYAQGSLSFGKARELARLKKYEFGLLLESRGISRHYGSEELEDDLHYAHRK